MSNMQNIFGTDGVRGRANTGYITPLNATKLAISVVNYLLDSDHKSVNSKFTVVLGKDTRLSGYMLEPALTAGFIAAGADVILLGPMPTPGVAFLTRSLRADLGVVISASHNPYYDNGIKFFNSKGYKISPDDEKKISEIFHGEQRLASPDHMGKAKRLDDAAGRYIEFAKSSFPRDLSLTGMKIVIDTANGAAYKIAPKIFWELGAEITTIGNDPNGLNINEKCGATHTEALSNVVLEQKADIGIALDGDADRLIVVDEHGKVLDGDYIIAAISTHWKHTNRLKSKSVITTIMSNMALEEYLESQGLELARSNVGDKYVLEKMIELRANIGGEKSGHIIPIDYSSTGDGSVAALQILAYLKQNNLKSSEIRKLYNPYPQDFLNIKLSENFKQSEFNKLVEKASVILGNSGRLIVRKSGTEPLIRVMIESNSSKLNSHIMQIFQS